MPGKQRGKTPAVRCGEVQRSCQKSLAQCVEVRFVLPSPPCAGGCPSPSPPRAAIPCTKCQAAGQELGRCQPLLPE